MKNVLRTCIIVAFFSLFLTLAPEIFAQTKRLKAEITQISERGISVRILDGEQKNTTVPVLFYDSDRARRQGLSIGDTVLVSFSESTNEKGVIIEDQYRLPTLTFLFGIFFGVVVVVGRKKGFLSFIGMFFSFLIIGKLLVPQILLGTNPVVISLLAAVLIIPVTFYITHGLTRKTTIAIISTFLTLLFTGILSYLFVIASKLTGFASEEASFIVLENAQVNIQNLLLAGIMIGAMGVLDDITVSQTSIVQKLRKANPSYTAKQLFGESLDIGRDHIASLVNTLVLVYAGAALPLFVLFSSTQFGTFFEVVNMEIVSTEIVRTLASSIGIIVAVPITTFMAVRWGK